MSHCNIDQRCYSNSPTDTSSDSDVSSHELFQKRQKQQHIIGIGQPNGTPYRGMYNNNPYPTLSELHTMTSSGHTHADGSTAPSTLIPHCQQRHHLSGGPSTTVYDCVSPDTTIIVNLPMNVNYNYDVDREMREPSSSSSSDSSSLLSLVDLGHADDTSLLSSIPSHGNSIDTTPAGLQSPALLSPTEYKESLQQRILTSINNMVSRRRGLSTNNPLNEKKRIVGDDCGCWGSFLLCGLGDDKKDEEALSISTKIGNYGHNHLSVINQMAVDLERERQEDSALFFATFQKILNDKFPSEGQFVTNVNRIKASWLYTPPNGTVSNTSINDSLYSVNVLPSRVVCVRSLQPQEFCPITLAPTNVVEANRINNTLTGKESSSMQSSLYANVGDVPILLPSSIRVRRVLLSSSAREAPISCSSLGNIPISSPISVAHSKENIGKQQHWQQVRWSRAEGAFSLHQISRVGDEKEKGYTNDTIDFSNVHIDKMLMSHFLSSFSATNNSLLPQNGELIDCDVTYFYNCMSVLPMSLTERCIRHHSNNSTARDNDNNNSTGDNHCVSRGVNPDENIHDCNGNNLMIFLRAAWLVLSHPFDFYSADHKRDSLQRSCTVSNNVTGSKNKTNIMSNVSRGRRGLSGQLTSTMANLMSIIKDSSAAAEEEYQLHIKNDIKERKGSQKANYRATIMEANSSIGVGNARDCAGLRVYDLNKILNQTNQQQLINNKNTASTCVQYSHNQRSINLSPPPNRLEMAYLSIIPLIVQYTKQQVFSRLENRDMDKKANTTTSMYHYYHPSTLLSLLEELKTELLLEKHYNRDRISHPKQQQQRQKTPYNNISHDARFG